MSTCKEGTKLYFYGNSLLRSIASHPLHWLLRVSPALLSLSLTVTVCGL